MYSDIYEEDSNFEVTCPYCNCEIDIFLEETIKEIDCPECNNVIEIDWEG